MAAVQAALRNPALAPVQVVVPVAVKEAALAVLRRLRGWKHAGFC